MQNDLPALLLGTSLRIRGAVRLPPDAHHPSGRRIIVQGATEHNANARDIDGSPVLICDYVPPTDRRSDAQLACRARMRAANAAWHALSQVEKRTFKADAQARRITAYNAFISHLLKTGV